MVLYPSESISPMRCVSAKWLLLGIISARIAPSVTGTSSNEGKVIAVAGDGAVGDGVVADRFDDVGAAVSANVLMDGAGVAGGILAAAAGGVADGCCNGPDGDA